LKRKSFGIERFEDKLANYKNTYIEELNKLDSVSICSCKYHNTEPTFVKWTDEFLSNVKNNIVLIENVFNSLGNVYLSFIETGLKVAIDNLWEFLETNDLLNERGRPTEFSNLLFRARKSVDFTDKTEIREYFHVPFNKRRFIGNQRFSVSGQPMLYFANSVIGVEKELETDLIDLSIASFLPRFELFYNDKFYEIKNGIIGAINSLIPIIRSGGQISYFDKGIVPNFVSVVADLKKSILSEILTFPVESKFSFVEEYILPQILTTALLRHDYKGIIYPSTKDYKELLNPHKYSSHEINIATFVNYSSVDSYDETTLSKYFTFTFDGSEKLNYSVSDVLNQFDQMANRIKKSKANNNNVVTPMAMARLHIEYLEKSEIYKIPYFETQYGKIELEFFVKMANALNASIL
jgi:hypothetical protein